jgi:tRNA-modifying protein YgfZ
MESAHGFLSLLRPGSTGRRVIPMSVAEGYDAARGRAAYLERPGRGKIAVAGGDRKTYLHAMLTNDIATLEAGTGCYAAYLTPQGRMITDLRVLELGDLALLEMPGGMAPVVLEKLDAFIFTEDVKLGDLTEAFAELRVVGPEAAAAVVGALGEGAGALTAGDLGCWAEFRNARVAFDGEMVLLAATRELGVHGFDLFVEKAHAGRLADALAAAGAEPLGHAAAEALRVEAGTPSFGADMDGETIPLEAGIEPRAISFTKGCYPGQEVIIRVLHRGHGRIAKRLVGLAVDGERIPAAGDLVRADGKDVGRVTSAAWSPLAGRPIALGYVKTDLSATGTGLLVAHEGEELTARVTALPIAATSG